MNINFQQLVTSFNKEVSWKTAARIFLHKDCTKDVATKVFQTCRGTPEANFAYERYLSFLARRGDEKGIREGIKLAQQDGLDRNWHSVFMQLHAFRWQTIEFAKLLQPTDTNLTNAFTYSLGEIGKFRAVSQLEEVWLKLVERGAPHCVYIASSFISCYCKKRDMESAMQWLAKLKKDRVPLSIVVYNCLIAGAAHQGDKQRVQQLLEEMKEQGFRPNSNTFTALVHAAINGGDQEVHHWIDEMKKEGVPPSVSIFSILINAAAIRRDMPTVQHWLKELRQAGLKPNALLFSGLINVAAKNGDNSAMKYWYEEMKKEGVGLIVNTFNAIISALASRCDEEGIENWLQEMIKEDVKPNILIFNTLIQMEARKGDMEGVQHWLKELKGLGLSPNEGTYFHLIDIASSRRDEKQVRHWIKEAEKAGLKDIIRPSWLRDGLD